MSKKKESKKANIKDEMEERKVMLSLQKSAFEKIMNDLKTEASAAAKTEFVSRKVVEKN